MRTWCSREPTTRRPVLLLRAALRARRQQERRVDPTPERQARQPLERQQRSRIPRRVRHHDRRRRTRHADHHRNGELHAAGLRDRQRGLMRAALVQAIHHARHRSAFGRLLADQPLMRNVLADLALESEAATVLFLRLARAFESRPMPPAHLAAPSARGAASSRRRRSTGSASARWNSPARRWRSGRQRLRRKRPMARFYREAPVNSIWEGSGNVMCLDVLRAMEREPEAAQALFAAWQADAQAHPALSAALGKLAATLNGPAEQREASARRIAQQIVLIAQARLLVKHAPAGLLMRSSPRVLPTAAAKRPRVRHAAGYVRSRGDHRAGISRLRCGRAPKHNRKSTTANQISAINAHRYPSGSGHT